MGELLRLQLQGFLGPNEFLFRTLARQQNGAGVLNGDRAQQFVFVGVRHHLPSMSCAASAVPSTRARILAKAVSRLVDVSSQKGENPQSSVVPS